VKTPDPGGEDQDRNHNDGNRPRDQLFQETRVALAHAFEADIESMVDAGKGTRRFARRGLVLPLQQQADRDRRQGPRQAVGRQHGEHHGETKWCEEEAGRAVEEDDGGEHAAYREGRHERGDGDAGRPVEGRQRQPHLLLGEQAMCVLDGDRGIVDQDADRQR
jgi:hypothetical protein